MGFEIDKSQCQFLAVRSIDPAPSMASRTNSKIQRRCSYVVALIRKSLWIFAASWPEAARSSIASKEFMNE